MVRTLGAERFETPPKPVENLRPSESGWTILEQVNDSRNGQGRQYDDSAGRDRSSVGPNYAV